MAKATYNLPKTEIFIIEDESFTLTLTAQEAITLNAVCGSIGGTFNSRRKHTAAISDALLDAGVDGETAFELFNSREMIGEIHFNLNEEI